jgi:hypothetical protein
MWDVNELRQEVLAELAEFENMAQRLNEELGTSSIFFLRKRDQRHRAAYKARKQREYVIKWRERDKAVSELTRETLQRNAEERKRRRGMRERLKDDRDGVAHHFTLIVRDAIGEGVHEIDGYLHTGVYPDGRVGEIFVKIGKPGDVYAALDQWAIAFSVALQYGAPLEALCNKFINQHFSPYGATKNKDIPRCTSIVDYVCRFLLRRYCKQDLSEEVDGPRPGEKLACGTMEVQS